MMNFREGKIDLGPKYVSMDYDGNDLDVLAEESLLEKRKLAENSAPFYYAESVESGKRFGLYFSLRQASDHGLLLRWLDGPCTSKGWDGVSEKALLDEYRQLLRFVEKRAGGPPDRKSSRDSTWCFKWGQLSVSYQPRDFAVAIFMKPH